MRSEESRPILIVDDDDSIRDLLAIALRSGGYQTIEAASAEEAATVLASTDVALMLLDNQLPGMSGGEFVARLRQDEATSTLPVIFVAGAGRTNYRVDALDAGADDYLAKPVKIAELLARVSAHLRRHAAWSSVIEHRHVRRVDRLRALLAIDAGEPREIADRICGVLAQDHPAVGVMAFTADRGGLLLAARDLAVAAFAKPALDTGLVDYLRNRAASGPWLERPGHAHLLDDGVGPLACAPMHIGTSLIGLLLLEIAAEKAFDPAVAALTLSEAIDYAAIAAHLFGPHLPENGRRAARRLEIEALLAAGQFEPVFQPIIDLATGTPVGFEALTRFDSGIRPDLVFEEASSLGLGLDLELATVAAVLADARSLPGDSWLSINVSPTLLCDVRLRPLLQQHRGELVLELTEHDRVEDYGAVRDAMAAMNGEVRLSVDDAGSGFASLQHILELQPDYIKLDRSWVAGIDTDLARQALVAGLGHFSDRVGCSMIAEGIETETELDTLRSLAAPLGQGFFFGRPVSVDLTH